eukprot:6190997-Pleurochrysis_carterae.AAC.1
MAHPRATSRACGAPPASCSPLADPPEIDARVTKSWQLWASIRSRNMLYRMSAQPRKSCNFRRTPTLGAVSRRAGRE